MNDSMTMSESPDTHPQNMQIQNYHPLQAPIGIQAPDTLISTMSSRFSNPVGNSCATIAALNTNLDHLMCPCCGQSGGYIIKRKSGASTYINCCCLTVFLCPLFWLPFCMNRCKDRQLFCVECGELKAIIPAKTCC